MIWIIGASAIMVLFGCLFYRILSVHLLDIWDEEWPWQTFARTHEKKPKEKGPEPGTIQIVEKMDQHGEVYYTAERWERLRDASGFHWCRMHKNQFTSLIAATPEEAQEKANAIVDEEREQAARKDAREREQAARRADYEREQAERASRADYSKVIGVFEPCVKIPCVTGLLWRH